MQLLADLHTHTVASGHAYSTATELATTARAKGLELIALTEHGPSVPGGAHPWTLWNMKVIPSVLDGVRILKGVEANPSLGGNGLDIEDEHLALLDFVACGFHPLVGFDDGDVTKNTEALVRIIQNPNVDMITHPGNSEFPIRTDDVVEAAVRHNVVLEINAHSFESTSSRAQNIAGERELLAAARDAGARVAVCSDAHYHLHVGRFENAIQVAEELGFSESDMVNRTAESTMEFLLSKRERPRLDYGGVWSSEGVFEPDGSEG
jgi:putative hydrolase